jgi:hypothetical protein
LVTVVFDAAFGRKCAVTGIISRRGRPKPLSDYDNVYIAPVPIARTTPWCRPDPYRTYKEFRASAAAGIRGAGKTMR